MPAPQLSSLESFHISKISPVRYQPLFLADNDGMVHLRASSVLFGNWAGNKIMEGVDDRNASSHFRRVADYNQRVARRIEEFRRGN